MICFPCCIVNLCVTLAIQQLQVEWLWLAPPDRKYWQNKETASIGLDSSVDAMPPKKRFFLRKPLIYSQFFTFLIFRGVVGPPASFQQVLTPPPTPFPQALCKGSVLKIHVRKQFLNAKYFSPYSATFIWNCHTSNSLSFSYLFWLNMQLDPLHKTQHKILDLSLPILSAVSFAEVAAILEKGPQGFTQI